MQQPRHLLPLRSAGPSPLVALLCVLAAAAALAHPPAGTQGMAPGGSMGGGMQCPMMGGGVGMFLGILGALLVLAAVAVLVALAVYLVRRSRPRGPVGA